MADTKISDLAAVTGLIGTDEFVLARAGDTKKIEASDLATFLGGGSELDYVERTTNLAVSATTASGADTFITGTSQAYAATRILVEVFVATVDCRQFVLLSLWDGSTDLGSIGGFSNLTGAASNAGATVHGMRFLTPSAATHQYIIKAWRGSTNANVYAGSGGTAGEYLPAFLRITVA